MSEHPQVRLARTPDGRRIEVAREIPVSRMLAWELLTDTWRWSDWGPTITEVDAPTRFIADGLHGRVNVLGAVWVPYEITSCDGERWTWDVARLPATGHRVEELTEERCRVVFELPLVAAPYVPVCKRALDRIEAILLGDAHGR
ncbi:SRPBCC family protein [Haloarchaeobius sp. HRN-SO-5]|uniref:SRPBCC family protein n=1 Tax=Haloarchaeobius sp. HRN-SO-5 TaxID=3446118 RepID=UPI003EB94399